MTNILQKADSGLGKLYDAATKTKNRAFFSGLLIYTLLFLLNFFLFMLPTIAETGSIMASDALAQYYPFLIDFRKDLLVFFEGLSRGEFTYPLVNFNFSYGDAPFLSCIDFLPLLPYYIFVAVIPEEAIPLFYGIGTVLLTYFSGISFYYMCRYFDKDPIISGFFTLLYPFCANAFYTALYNQHFLYMFVAFPLMIAGIDKIINKKSCALFVLTTAWLAISGIPFLVYTVPFVVLFALIRVRFVYKEHYFKNLGICFVKGFGAFLLGLGIMGVLFLPSLIELLTSNRSTEFIRLTFVEMITPDFSMLSQYLVQWSTSGTGICTAVLPLIVYFIADKKSSQQYRIYLTVMSVLVSLPLIYYGLNGFQYEICRWGFIPGALLCYIGISTVQELSRTDKLQAIIFTVMSVIYLALIILSYYEAAALFMAVCCLIKVIPPVRRFFEKLGTGIVKLYREHKAARLAVPFLGFIVFMLIFLSVISNGFGLPVIPIAAVLSAIIIVWLYFKLDYKRVTSVLLAAAVISVSYMYLSGERYIVAPFYDAADEMNALNDTIIANTPDNCSGRISILSNPRRTLTVEEAEAIDNEETEDETAYTEQDDTVSGTSSELSAQEYYEAFNAEQHPYQYFPEPDGQVNISLRYGLPDTYVFQSVINGSLTKLLKRCGADASVMLSQVNLNGFDDNPALDSLFGVSYFCYPQTYDYAFGRDEIGRIDIMGNNDVVVYRNNFAYPVGVTYSNIIGADEFYSLDAATFPYAMMNAVYLEGSPLSESAPNSGKEFAHRCDIKHDRTSRGTTSYGIECFNNTITINDNVEDCLLFLSFNDVKVAASFVYSTQDVKVKIDNKIQVTGKFQNPNDRWDWIALNDHYTVPLGYFENGAKTLEFVSPFEYSELYVTAVPVSEFYEAYEKCTAETLQNIEYSTNTLSGSITVSEDKVLSINILYNPGWKAYVDGAEASVYKSNDTFLAIPLQKGTHDVKLVFTRKYATEGLILSIVSAVILIAVLIVSKRGKKNAPQS